MPILNSIGALSIEEGGDNVAGNTSTPIVSSNFLKVVPNHTGNVYILKFSTRFEIYERDANGYYQIATTINSPTGWSSPLTMDCDINKTGDAVVVSFYDSGVGKYISAVLAYQLIGGVWTLSNTITDSGASNINNKLGESISLSWADTGCVITQYTSNVTSPGWYDGYVYYYGNIWSATTGSVRTTLSRISSAASGKFTYPKNVQITKDGSYARVGSITASSSVHQNLDVWSITTKSSATLPISAKWHEFSDKRNELNREFNAKILSGDKNVSFEMNAAMDTLTITWDLLISNPPVLPTITILSPVNVFVTSTAVAVIVALSTGVGIPIYSISPSLPSGLSFDIYTAKIYGTPQATSNTTLYTVTVSYDEYTVSKTLSISVTAPPIQISPFKLYAGKNISLGPVAVADLTTVSGGYPNKTYSVVGELPPGITFNSATATFSGTPTELFPIYTPNQWYKFSDSFNSSFRPKGAAYGNGVFVVLSFYSTTKYSSDGITWNNSNLSGATYNNLRYNGYTWGQICFGGGKFLAIGEKVISDDVSITKTPATAVSVDGISWTITDQNDYVGKAICHNGTSFLSIGNGYTISSVDGVVWTKTINAALTTQWNSLIFAGGKYVAVGGSLNDGKISTALYSEDGTTWISTTLPIRGLWSSVAYNNGLYIAVAIQAHFDADCNKAVISKDGKNWEIIKLPGYPNDGDGYFRYFGEGSWQSIVSYRGGFCAIGATIHRFGGIKRGYTSTITAQSYDGITWTTSYVNDTNISTHAHVYAAAVNGDTLVVTGDSWNTIFTNKIPLTMPSKITVTDGVMSASNYFAPVVNFGEWSVTAPTITFELKQNKVTPVFYPFVPAGSAINNAVYSSSDLPNGIVIDSATGGISGTATDTGTYTSTINVTAKNNYADKTTITLTFNVPALSIIVNNTILNLLPKTTVVMAQPVTASGGTAPYTYSISPALPVGLSMNSATGAIGGTCNIETSGTHTITVTDSSGVIRTSTITIRVASDLTISTTDFFYEIGTSITTQPITITGTGSPFTVSISPSLPNGLTMNTSTGVISGSPTVGATTTHTVTVTDKYGVFKQATLRCFIGYLYKLTSATDPTSSRWTRPTGYVYIPNKGILVPAKITNMANMFDGTSFNDSEISNWDVSTVTTMASMFAGTTQFNQPLSNWNTSKVTDMSSMFSGAALFNQAIGSWNVSKVTTINSMFADANVFNKPIGSWDTSSVTDMSAAFRYARVFDQPLNTWNTSNVTLMNSMFYGAAKFNSNITTWNVSKVTNITYMFFQASLFNQNISGLYFSSITTQPSGFSTSSNSSWISNRATMFPKVNINGVSTTIST
jgi:surface protein